MPRIDVLISVIRILSIFFYTAILQGLTIQQYKNRKILKYKYKTRLKLLTRSYTFVRKTCTRGEYINKNKKNKNTNKQTNKKNKNRKIK